MINRTTAPGLEAITDIRYVQPQVTKINDFSSLFWMNRVPDDTVRIELHFDAGSIRGKKSVAALVNAMLFSGTESKSHKQINEELDQLGAYLDHEVSLEKAFVSAYCLRSNAQEVIDKLAHALLHATFPQREIDDMVREKKQNLRVSREKVSILARQEFQKQLFAGNASYARFTEETDFDEISREDLLAFHEKQYKQGLKNIVVVANVEQKIIDQLLQNFGACALQQQTAYELNLQNQKGIFRVEKKGAIQTAIRIGLPVFNKKDANYTDFLFMQTILGDYFGSRLMSNIREDKGYTYGIGSALVELKTTGYFVIATEVASEVADATLKEVQYEMERLKTELVPEEELELVKNYLLGQMLKSADGPNAMMDLYLGVRQHQLDFSFYGEFMKQLAAMNAEKVRHAAQKYLNWDNFTIILAG